MQSTPFIRNYGRLMFLPIYVLINSLGHIGFQITYNQYLIDLLIDNFEYDALRLNILIINGILFISIICAFLFLTYFYFSKNNRIFLVLFIPFIVVCQFFLTSFFVDIVEMENGFYADTNIGVIWVLILPMNIIMLFIMGTCFDYLKNRYLKPYSA